METLLSLREAAFEHLRQQGISEDQNDYVLVNEAGNYGTEEHVLRNLVAHLPNHSAKDIVGACLEAKFAKLPEDELLIDDHIVVSRKLMQAYADDNTSAKKHYKLGVNNPKQRYYQRGTNGAPPDEYRKIMRYAMSHIEDGPLIVSMVYERGIGTLDGILEFLAVLKSSGHSALTEGVL